MRLPGAHAKAGGACHQPSGQDQISLHQPSMPEDSGAKESLLQGYVHPTGGHNMGVTGGGAEETGSGGGRAEWASRPVFAPGERARGPQNKLNRPKFPYHL